MSPAARDRVALLSDLNRTCTTPHGALELEASVPFGAGLVERYRMANGLTVLCLEDHSAQVVSYQTWFRVGSRHEKPGKTGLAHLFEHLMFNETQGLPAGEFDRLLEASGAEVNAATWLDWTFYYENVPSAELGLVIKLEAQRMSQLVLRDPQVASEKEVVANERRYRVEDDVEGAVNELLYSTAFTEHPYSWPTIGFMADIEGFTTADCEAFYATYYAPNNAALVLVGAFELRAALESLQNAYGSLPAAELPLEAVAVEPLQTQERRLTVEKPTPTEKLLLGYKSPALDDPDYVPLSVLSDILVGGKSSRLYRALVTEMELATEVRASLSPTRYPGLFEFWVSLRPGRTAEEALGAIEQVLAALGPAPVTESELTKAKNRSELSVLQGLETASGKAEQLGFYETVLGDPAFALSQLFAYRQVTREDVQRVSRATFDPARRTTIFVRAGEPADAEAA